MICFYLNLTISRFYNELHLLTRDICLRIAPTCIQYILPDYDKKCFYVMTLLPQHICLSYIEYVKSENMMFW